MIWTRLLVYGDTPQEIEEKLPQAISQLLTAKGARVESVKIERYPGVLPQEFVPGVYYAVANTFDA